MNSDLFSVIVSYIPDNLEMRLVMKNNTIIGPTDYTDRSQIDNFLYSLYINGYYTKKYYLSKKVVLVEKNYVLAKKYIATAPEFDLEIHALLLKYHPYLYIRDFASELTPDEYYSLTAKYRVVTGLNKRRNVFKSIGRSPEEMNKTPKSCWEVVEWKLLWGCKIRDEDIELFRRDRNCLYRFHITLCADRRFEKIFCRTAKGIYIWCRNNSIDIIENRRDDLLAILLRCAKYTYYYCISINKRIPEFEEKIRKKKMFHEKYVICYILRFNVVPLFIIAGLAAWKRNRALYFSLIVSGQIEFDTSIPLDNNWIKLLIEHFGKDVYKYIDPNIYGKTKIYNAVKNIYNISCPDENMTAIMKVRDMVYDYEHERVDNKHVAIYLRLCDEGLIDPFDAVPDPPEDDKCNYKFSANDVLDLYRGDSTIDVELIKNNPDYYLENGLSVEHIMEAYSIKNIPIENFVKTHMKEIADHYEYFNNLLMRPEIAILMADSGYYSQEDIYDPLRVNSYFINVEEVPYAHPVIEHNIYYLMEYRKKFGITTAVSDYAVKNFDGYQLVAYIEDLLKNNDNQCLRASFLSTISGPLLKRIRMDLGLIVRSHNIEDVFDSLVSYCKEKGGEVYYINN